MIDKFEQSIQKLINEVLELLKVWRQRRLEAENQIKSLEAKLAGYQTVLKDYWNSIDIKDRGNKKA